MDIKIQSVNFDADKELVLFVEEKVEKLQQYFDNIVSVESFLKVEKSDSFENKIAEIKVMLPGKEIFAKKHAKSFEEAVDESLEALRRQLMKYKDKLHSK
jgi:putative sigma-54 modulation protein